MKKSKKILIAILVPIFWIGLLYSGMTKTKFVSYAVEEGYIPSSNIPASNGPIPISQNQTPPPSGLVEAETPQVKTVPSETPVATVPSEKKVAAAKAVEAYSSVQEVFEKKIESLLSLKKEAAKAETSVETKQAASEEARKPIVLDLQDWHSVDAGFMNKIAECGSDVIIECVYEGKNYRFVIPAGSAKMIEGVDWYGPLCLQNLYGNSYVGE